MNIPEQLSILGKEYLVSPFPPNSADGKKFLGTCNDMQCVIHYHPAVAQDQLAETLIHEAIHALSYALHIQLKELQVHTLAVGIFALLKDNPDLIQLINSREK